VNIGERETRAYQERTRTATLSICAGVNVLANPGIVLPRTPSRIDMRMTSHL
jgi:hypothetical protein